MQQPSSPAPGPASGESTTSTAPSAPGVNERLAKFEQAVHRVRSGADSVEQFGAWLTREAEEMSRRRQDILEVLSSIPPGLEDAFREEVEVGLSGIGFYEQGLACMFKFVETRQDAALDDGLAAMRQGNARINEAMRINLANRDEEEEPSAAPVDDEPS